MPADLCIPRLSEGDQLFSINGHDVVNCTHAQVVSLIRAASEDRSGVLELLVRPSDYVLDEWNNDGPVVDSGDAPPLPPRASHLTALRATSTPNDLISSLNGNIRRLVSTTNAYHIADHGTTTTGGRVPVVVTDPLLQSMLELEAGLADGSLLTQFEQLPRKKPGYTTDASRLNENVLKNRYRDISPYDQTRVILKQGSGDYINANYVIMDFPKAGFALRYIAAQGPLPSTYGDFWQMCWEQHVNVVVMLTAISERGRVKCHQYWPNMGQTLSFNASRTSPIPFKSNTQRPVVELQLETVREEIDSDFAYREFLITPLAQSRRASTPTDAGNRRVVQLQYISWPDHGVPGNTDDLITFVDRVREARGSCSRVPIVVHCSAGIGRTGVLITIETALNLMERDQPVRPIELVQLMRAQRALLIQTTSQFQFVCETILKVFQREFLVFR
ncbi:Tyrosine-protein phosphatase non-receptor type 4 [Fasciola gigantica]|uniref:Tyrosine-protein phosphatase non-receptor type 4 n=1 Tax=Fasciola gigantica TaxID=46835 RepID=A0A504YJC3_FASGI|nr:Tyrosine-protein phosphatase non-receptor type 4 [Fasciola gigantica]